MNNATDTISTQRRALEKEALAGLFRKLETRAVRYAVLRNHETLPDSLGARDLDIVLEPVDLPKAVDAVRDLTNELALAYATFFRDERLTQFTLTRRLETGELFDIKIDFFINSQVYGIEVLPASRMLDGAWRHNGIPVVSDSIKLLDKWLFHLIVGQPLHPKYEIAFAGIAAADETQIVGALAPIFGHDTAQRLVGALTAGRGSAIAPLPKGVRFAALIRLWRRQDRARIAPSIAFAQFRLRDRLRPAGIFLSVSGPDGSGKTTVIDLIIAQFKQVFGTETVSYRHFRPSLLPRIASVAKASKAIQTIDDNYSDPHRAQPSGAIGSLARLGYYSLDYFGGYLRSIHPLLMRREVVLFDRYVYDMIADPGRSRIGLSAAIIRAAAQLLPKPCWPFFIRVKAETAHARKQELSLEAIRTLNARYGDLVDRGMLIPVDNDGAPETTAATIVDRIIADRDARARYAMETFAR